MTSRSLFIALVALGGIVRESDAQASPPKRQLVEELRLDSSTDDFPDVANVMVSPRGQIAVMVGNDQQLRFYDATGKKTGTFGRVGSGPGEFRRAVWFGWKADTLWAYDVDQRRITFISPTGTLLRTEVLSQSLNTMFARGGPPSQGAIVLFVPRAIVKGQYIGTALVNQGRNAQGTMDSKATIMAVAGSGSIKSQGERSGQLTPAGDSIGTGARTFLADQPATQAAAINYSPGDGSSFGTRVPFMFYPATEFSPDGSRFGFLTTEPGDTGGTYSLSVFTTTGDTIFSRAYRHTGVPVPKAALDSAIGRIGMGQDGRMIYPPAVAAKMREMGKERAPKFYQPVSGFVLGRDNTAWIQMRRTPQGSSAILIDARGNQVAMVDLPPRTRIIQGTRDALWTIQTDQDDLPSVVRFRVK